MIRVVNNMHLISYIFLMRVEILGKDGQRGWFSFIDDACDEGISVVILTAFSKFGEETARSITEKLGLERKLKLKVIGRKEIERSMYGQLVLGVGTFSGLDEEISNEASKAVAAQKKKIAEEVSSMLKLRVDLNTGTTESGVFALPASTPAALLLYATVCELDSWCVRTAVCFHSAPCLLDSGACAYGLWLQEIVAALRAGSEIAEVPICNSVVVAGNLQTVYAAEATGMPCIVLRNSLTSRAEFRSTVAVMDGFGDVDLTVSKMRTKLTRFSQ
ncbi:Adenosylhomocysteinase [Bienertia sinuspersici]